MKKMNLFIFNIAETLPKLFKYSEFIDYSKLITSART